MNGWAVTLLDVLTGVDEIKVCTKYIYNGEDVTTIPSTLEEYQAYKPYYITLKGWKEDISNVKSFEQLPKNAQKYLKTIEKYKLIRKYTKVPVVMFSVGQDRTQTVVLHDPYND